MEDIEDIRRELKEKRREKRQAIALVIFIIALLLAFISPFIWHTLKVTAVCVLIVGVSFYFLLPDDFFTTILR